MKVLMGHCPSCESTRVYPSQVRNPIERLRQFLTRKRPFRCHACQWRGWAFEAWNSTHTKDDQLEWPPDARVKNPLSPDQFDDIDIFKSGQNRKEPRR